MLQTFDDAYRLDIFTFVCTVLHNRSNTRLGGALHSSAVLGGRFSTGWKLFHNIIALMVILKNEFSGKLSRDYFCGCASTSLQIFWVSKPRFLKTPASRNHYWQFQMRYHLHISGWKWKAIPKQCPWSWSEVSPVGCGTGRRGNTILVDLLTSSSRRHEIASDVENQISWRYDRPYSIDSRALHDCAADSFLPRCHSGFLSTPIFLT